MRNGSGSSSTTFPVTIHEVHQGIKQDKTFDQDLKDNSDNNSREENITAVTQMDFTHDFPIENHVP
jgi:hypothetical protein